MSRFNLSITVVPFIIIGLVGMNELALGQATPKALNGQIITSSSEIQVPSQLKDFTKKLRKQDKKQFSRNAKGQWVIHFVAFFSRPLPSEQLGIVVLDAKKEPVAVADVAGHEGQRTLSSRIVVDGTETPGKQHTIQIYYPKGNLPFVLAKKMILLK